LEARSLSAVLAFILAVTGMGGSIPPGDAEHVLLLVNREHPVGFAYVPEPLVRPNVLPAPGKEENITLRPEAAAALEKLFQAAQREGITLYAVSGYRSYYTQKRLFQSKAAEVGERQAMRTVATAGTSEHQLGLAMDINGQTTLKKGLSRAFAESPEGKWVAENAQRYGFIIRYPQGKTKITGYAWEPWHLRYVGVEAAMQVYALDITFEEYHLLMEMAEAAYE